MPEYIRIDAPWNESKSIDDIKNSLKDHIVRGLVPVTDETITFSSGTTSYELDFAPVSPTTDNVEIEGTLNGIPHVFRFDIDYSISGKNIIWNTDNDNPDDGTKFYVDYTYQGTKSGIADEDPASLAMIRLDAVARVIYDVREKVVKRSYYAGYMESATGNDLKKVTALVGAQKTAAAKAQGTLKLLFTQAATVGTPISVSANNKFSTKASATENLIYFETLTGSTWSTGETYGYIGIQALEAGLIGRVGANTILNMVDPITNVESITNPSSTTDGYNEESDDDFRERAPLAKESKGKSTPGGIKYDLLNIPGVDNIKVKESWFGTAHSAIFVIPDDFPPTAILQGRVDGALESGRAMGTHITAQYPNVINAWMNISMERTPLSDSGSVFRTVSGDVFNYIKGLNLGERFIQQQFNRKALTHKDAVRVISYTIAETGNVDLWVNTDQVLRPGYRTSGTGNNLGVFNEAESIQCSGDYSTGWISPLGLDTYASGLSVYANTVSEIFAVYLSGNTLCSPGIDYTLYSSGYISGQSFFGRNWNAIQWLTGATNYPLNGTPYSVMYKYNAIQIDVTATGEF